MFLIKVLLDTLKTTIAPETGKNKITKKILCMTKHGGVLTRH